jgi:NTP pyrophosphatase (non-canonical NTP hydrolase)
MASAIRQQRQISVGEWTREAFGPEDFTPQVRARKLLEETAEAAQAAGVPEEQAVARLRHVYSRPVGDLAKEIGGVGITLLALAECAGINADREEERDLEYILSKPMTYWMERNATKKAERIAAGMDL